MPQADGSILKDNSVVKEKLETQFLETISNAITRVEELDQVDNTSDLSKPVSTAVQEKFDILVPIETNSFNNVLRKDDTLYNILDQYTKESVTYTKVTTLPNGIPISDADVDNIIYIKIDTEYFKRDFTGDIQLEWFNPILDGTTDNLVIITKALKASKNHKLSFPKKKELYLSDNIHINFSIDINMNGCELIAPKGFIDQDTDGRVIFNSGSYFNTVKGNTFISKIVGVTDNLQIGNVIILQSESDYITEGAYKHGQIMIVQAITSDKIYFNQPFYDVYQVDTITIYSGETFNIENGIINMSDNIGSNRGINVFGYKTITAKNVHCIGSLLSESGLEGAGDYVEFTACSATGYLNSNGFGSTGRKGYGLAAIGNYVAINNCVGNSCKHLFCSGNRLITSLYVVVNSFQGFNPPEGFAEMAQLSGGGPLYQHMIDAHANVLQFIVNEPVLDGCNGMIAIRNGWAIINNPVLRSRGVNVNFNNTYLIMAYEHQIESIVINNPTLYVDPKVTGQTTLPTLFGMQNISMHGNNKSIRINNPTFMDGGYIFKCLSSTNPARSGVVNIEDLSIIGIRGKVSGGVAILGPDSTHTIGNIGKVEIEGDFEFTDTLVDSARLVDIAFCNSFKKLTVRGRIDYSKYKGSAYPTTTDTAIVTSHLGASKPIEHLDFEGLDIKSFGSTMSFGNNGVENWGSADFRNIKILFNVAGESSRLGIFANLLGTTSSPTVGVWDFTGASIKTATPEVSTGVAFNFPALSKLILDGLQVNKPLSIVDTTYLLSRLALGIIPKIINDYGGSVTYAGYTIKGDGKLYIGTSLQSNAGSANAVPNFTPLFTGFTVYNTNYNGTTPYGWIGNGSGWTYIVLNSNSVQYHQANILVTDNLNTYTKNGIFSITTQSVADGVTNIPTNFAGILEVKNLAITNDNATCVQEYVVTAAGIDQNKKYQRVCSAGTWAAWKTLNYL